jgi:hypothetical protein
MRTLPLLGAATLLLAACSTGGTGGTGSPSASGSGGLSSLINVNLSNIRAEIAKNVDLNLEDVPITIQLPITVAANVCGVDVKSVIGECSVGRQHLHGCHLVADARADGEEPGLIASSAFASIVQTIAPNA